MFSREEKLKQSSPVNNDGEKHSNSAKQLNGECTGNQPGNGHPHEQAETFMELGAPLEKGESKTSALPEINAVAASGEKKLEEEYEKGGSVVSGEHPAAATDRPLHQLSADALLPDGGFSSSAFSLGEGGGAGHSSPSDVSQVDVVQKKNKANEGTPPPPSSSNSNSNSSKTIQLNGSSPFMKRSPIWNAIESMQVFHKFPQNPHFLPLLDLNEDSREGFAIGHMVNFANVAEKAFKLKITQDLTTCLETLQDFEPHGFDVTAVRDHLKKMLSIKEAQQKLREKKTRLENRMLELTQEHSEIDNEIVKFNEKMKRLQEKLASAKSKKGEKLSEIVFLKGKSGSISQLIDGAAQEDPAEYYLKLAALLP